MTRTALLGLPFDHHSSHLRGAATAPPLIRKALASDSANPWSERGVDVSSTDVFRDAGDVVASETDSHGAIHAAVTAILEARERPLCIGGDHAVTWPVMEAMAAAHDDITILHIDAHPDLYDDFEGNPASHASPFARIMERGLAARLIQVGIRTLTPHQRQQVARFGITCIEARHCAERLPTLAIQGPVYVSIDLDGLDPACAPGVSHPEPGGLSTRDVIDLIHRLEGPVIGADIVEYNPTRDHHDLTAYVAAKLVKELIASA